MRGNRRISSRTCQILAILVGNVLALAVLVALGQAEIDNVDVVTRGLRPSNQEIIRLNVSMDYSLFVHLLNPLDQLNANQKARLQVKSTLAS